MTIRLLATYDRAPPQSIVTIDPALETAFVAAGNASFDLTGGTIYYREINPTLVQPEPKRGGTLHLNANRKATIPLDEGIATVITGGTGAVGTVQRYDATGTAVGGLIALTVGPMAQIGPFTGNQTIELKTSVGGLDVLLFDAAVSAGQVQMDAAGNAIGLKGPNGQVFGLGIFSAAATDYYKYALRASQPGYGSPLDQSGKLNDPLINGTLYPLARANNAVVAQDLYRSPATLNGKLYKATTGGTTAGAEPAGMAGAAIGATVVDNTLTWTVQRGPWYTAASGYQHITSIASGLLPARGSVDCPTMPWDMAQGDSFIISLQMAWNANATDSRTALAESVILANRHISGTRNGIQLTGTGSSFDDMRLLISDGVNSVQSGHFLTTFNRKPLDGTMRKVLIAVDGVEKRAKFWVDRQPVLQAEMFDGTNLTPHNLDLSTITGSTLSPNQMVLGGAPGSSTSVDFGVIAMDVIVLPKRALPTNMQAVADFYYSRGADALLPAGLLQT